MLGDGDFDFVVKIDKSIMDNAKRKEKFLDALRSVLAKKSNDPKSSLTEIPNTFKYKKVKIEGVDEPIDIDLTFMTKSEEITYSTDMCLQDRLNGLKRTNPEGYKYTVANIILAKKLLKENELYKKSKSDGASKYGGFGGVGVENWILQNGGSFIKAMQTFLDTAKEFEGYNEFIEKYPIYDFGENHKGMTFLHDSLVRGMTYEGFKKMQEVFPEIIKSLTPTNIRQNGINREDVER